MPEDQPEHGREDVERFSNAEKLNNAVVDADIVNFDGHDDPDNAMNWSLGKKAATLGMVTAMTLLSYVSCTILSSGTPAMPNN